MILIHAVRQVKSSSSKLSLLSTDRRLPVLLFLTCLGQVSCAIWFISVVAIYQRTRRLAPRHAVVSLILVGACSGVCHLLRRGGTCNCRNPLLLWVSRCALAYLLSLVLSWLLSWLLLLLRPRPSSSLLFRVPIIYF
jgi:hypothetical protein